MYVDDHREWRNTDLSTVDRGMRINFKRWGRLLLALSLMIVSALFAIWWMNAVGMISAWTGLERQIDPKVLRVVRLEANMFGKLSLLLGFMASWVLRFPEFASVKEREYSFSVQLFRRIWDNRNNYFVRLMFTIAVTLPLIWIVAIVILYGSRLMHAT